MNNTKTPATARPCVVEVSIMARMAWVAFISLVAALTVVSEAFVVPPQARWLAASPNSAQKGTRYCSSTPVRTRFLSTARGTSETDSKEDEISAVTPRPPDDDVYYSGQVGSRPNKGGGGDSEVDKFTEYPINLPSYLLLCLSAVASIAFIGGIFEVTGGHPQLGYTPTYVIGTLALPTFIFLFYAAIKKGQAEVEEDDAKFDGTW